MWFLNLDVWPPQTLADTRLYMGAGEFPENGRGLRRGGSAPLHLGNDVRRNEGIERGMHVNGMMTRGRPRSSALHGLCS